MATDDDDEDDNDNDNDDDDWDVVIREAAPYQAQLAGRTM